MVVLCRFIHWKYKCLWLVHHHSQADSRIIGCSIMTCTNYNTPLIFPESKSVERMLECFDQNSIIIKLLHMTWYFLLNFMQNTTTLKFLDKIYLEKEFSGFFETYLSIKVSQLLSDIILIMFPASSLTSKCFLR